MADDSDELEQAVLSNPKIMAEVAAYQVDPTNVVTETMYVCGPDGNGGYDMPVIEYEVRMLRNRITELERELNLANAEINKLRGTGNDGA